MPREVVETAGRIQLTREGDAFIVSRRWASAGHAIAFGLALVVGILAVLAFTHQGERASSPRTPSAWLLGAAAIGLFYSGFTIFNRTSIRIDARGIEVRRGPLPSLGARRRCFPNVHGIEVRLDRVITARGGVAATHVVEGVGANGRLIVLDLVRDARTAEAMARMIREAMSRSRSD